MKNDPIQNVGGAASTAGGAAVCAAAAPAVANATGATAIPVLTTLGKLVGLSIVHATPIGWFVGLATLGGTLGYGVYRLIANGTEVTTERKIHVEQTQEVRERRRCNVRARSLSADTLTKLKTAAEDAVEQGRISVKQARRLAQEVQLGSIPIERAHRLLAS